MPAPCLPCWMRGRAGRCEGERAMVGRAVAAGTHRPTWLRSRGALPSGAWGAPACPCRELHAEILHSHLPPPSGRSSPSFSTWHTSTRSVWNPCTVSAGLSPAHSPLSTLREKEDKSELAAQAPQAWGTILTEQPRAAPHSLSSLLTSPSQTEPRPEPGLA